MSCFYCVEGSMRVHANEASQELIEQLKDELGEIEYESELVGPIVAISIHGGMGCSYSTATEIDDLLKQVGEHAIESACFITTCDDEECEIWVGKEPDVSQAIRNSLVAKARDALKELTVEEAESLLNETQNPEFWRK